MLLKEKQFLAFVCTRGNRTFLVEKDAAVIMKCPWHGDDGGCLKRSNEQPGEIHFRITPDPSQPTVLSGVLDKVEEELERRYGPDWRNADQGPDSDLGIIALLYGFLANREVLPPEAKELPKKIRTGYINGPQAE